MIKKDINIIRNDLVQKGYKIIGEYKNTQTPVKCEKDGYWYNITYSNFQLGKKPVQFGLSNPYLEHNIRVVIKKRNADIKYISMEVVTKKHRKRIMVTMECTCGNIFKKDINDIISKKCLCCYQCASKHRGKNHRINTNIIIDTFIKNGYTILSDTSDILTSTKLLVVNTDGYKGWLSYNHLCQGKSFAIFSLNSNKDNYIYNINNYCKINGIKSKAIGFADFERWTKPGVKMLCECGNEYETSIASLCNSKIRCDKCSAKMSIYEYKVEEFLKEQNINYICEYRINSCKDILPLPFDFYLVDYNKLIEVDGVQHFFAYSFSPHSTKEDAEKQFIQIQKHDKIKNQYCKKHNIPLLRIHYNNFKTDKYKEQIIQFIKE